MKLSVFSINTMELIGTGRFTEQNEVFAYTKSLGIEMVDVFDSEFSDDIEGYKTLLERQGLKMNSIIAFSPISSKDEEVFNDGVNKAKGLIDTALQIGAKYILLVPEADNIVTDDDKTFARDRMIDGLRRIVNYAKGKAVTITIENFSDSKHPFSTIEEVRLILENVPGLKYTFDCGNYACIGVDMLEAYDELKQYIVNVHLKDWIWDNDGFIADADGHKINGSAIGYGFIKIRELLQNLKRDSYKGALVIEYNSNNRISNEIEQSVDFLRSENIV